MAVGKFRTIIIGGGPVGLAIANGLDRAGLDFLVVERHHTIISESGACIMLWPHSTRVFDQLGIMEACEGRYIPVTDKGTMHLDGTPMRRNDIFKCLADNHGYQCMNFPRPSLLQTLFEGLPNKSKIRTGVGIEDIETTEMGVRVHLSDGSIEEGSIVIGADGVHSKTRGIMRKLANDAGRDLTIGENSPVASYQIMYGRAKYIPNADVGTFFETHGTNMSSQMSADKNRIHFGIYRKLPHPTTEMNKEYSKEEVAEFVEAFSNVKVMPRMTFGEVYKHCTWTRLVNQHEGVIKHWYHGRVVLAGDSCCVMNPAAGMGVNNGIQSGVVLVNKLHELLSRTSAPSTKDFERVFEEYQNARRDQSQFICDFAAKMIRINTWDSYLAWFMGDVVVPRIMSEEKLVTKLGTSMVRDMQKFSFLEGGLRSGRVPWSSP
ncbi:hypothetical protein F4777DRAFT_512060 [Nemania sp. FL0916]|nr:hypothetical protein F4777DRAFT_512060 [Nemania sp. FL0916]